MKERTYQIVLEGIVITVTKKRIKNMYLRCLLYTSDAADEL